MTNLTIPDEAVEAALWAWIESATEGVTRENVAPRVLDLNRPRAAAALTATLAILHPTIPNTIEALGALPDGAILRAKLGSGAITATREGDEWGTAGNGWLHTSDELARHYSRITEWTVLWPLGGAA